MHSEYELITELKKGNEWAVEKLVDLYGDRLLRVALVICGDMQWSEEIVQDTMLKACQNIHTFQGRASLSTWLFRIAVNLAKNKLRSNSLKKVVPWDESKIDLVTSGKEHQPDSILMQKEQEKAILASLQLLPLKYREVLTLYYLEDLSVKEISMVHKEPQGTIKSKMSRGRNLLKEILIKGGVYY